MLEETQIPKNTKPGKPKRIDYEYIRNEVSNIFVTIEPKGGHREVTVTDRRTRTDFAREIARIISLPRYKDTVKIHLVLDNLNTHFEKSFFET